MINKINILNKGEKVVRVKGTSKRKAHVRHVKSGKGEEKKKYKVETFSLKLSDDININLLDNYVSKLPAIDTDLVGAIFLDYDLPSHLADTSLGGIDSTVWDNWGDDRTEKFLKKKIREKRDSFIYYNPIWETDKQVKSEVVTHEIGHIVFDSLPRADKDFWINTANIEGIGREDVKESIKLGRSTLIFEYFADHYAMYHSDKKLPDAEVEWFNNRYNINLKKIEINIELLQKDKTVIKVKATTKKGCSY